MEIRFGRAEPYWGYQDVSSPARPVVISRGSWRRWEAVLSLSRDDDSGHEPPASSRSPLRAFASREHYLRALAPWLKGVSQQSELHDKVADKCQEFVCHDPEYCGSLHGGWDGPNQMFLEDGVSRGEFGEYLFNEFFGSGEDRFYRMGFDFGQIYRHLFCFTLPGASDGDHELGGAKSRQSEHRVDSIRSYRGAVLLTTMYQETGDERYLKAVRQRADYHLANYPHPVGRLSMANRDTAFMARYLQRPELIDKAVESILHSLDKHFDQEFGFFELYDESNELPDGRFPAHRIDSGMWFMRDFLFTVNASPEMTAYNIIGWYGMLKLHDPGPDIGEKIRRVCEWFRDRQNEDGSWPYPHATSTTRWGHGCLRDAMAVLYAYRMFGDPSYLEAARRSIDFAEACLKEHGRIPLVLGIVPHEETEDSLTYYYGLETLAVYNEIASDSGQPQECQRIIEGVPTFRRVLVSTHRS